MDSGNSSDELFSDTDGGTDGPFTYKQYLALKKKGAKPPSNGYVLRTSSGESEADDGEDEVNLARKRGGTALKITDRAKKARVKKTKGKGKQSIAPSHAKTTGKFQFHKETRGCLTSPPGLNVPKRTPVRLPHDQLPAESRTTTQPIHKRTPVGQPQLPTEDCLVDPDLCEVERTTTQSVTSFHESTPSTQKFNGCTKTRRRLTTPPWQRTDRTFDVPRRTPAGPTQLRESFQEDPDLCEEDRTTQPLPPFQESTSSTHTSSGDLGNTISLEDPDLDVNGPASPAQSGDQSDVLTALQKTNLLLSKLVKRVALLEKKSTNKKASTGNSSFVRKNADVPLAVRRETRRIYKMLLNEDNTFNGWSFGSGVTFRSEPNQSTLSHLVREVKALNPQFLGEHISGAAYRYFLSCGEAVSLKNRGKDVERVVHRRRKERLLRKLAQRKSALANVSFIDASLKRAWEGILAVDMMSSEESATEGDEEVYLHRSLPWRSARVTQMFKDLDSRVSRNQSALSRRQRKRRVTTNEPSSRPKPAPGSYPVWAFN